MERLIPGQRYIFSPPDGSRDILIWSLTYQPKTQQTDVTEWRFLIEASGNTHDLVDESPTTWSEMIKILKECYPGETKETLEPRINLAHPSIHLAWDRKGNS